MICKQCLEWSLRFLGLMILALPSSVSGQPATGTDLKFNIPPRYQIGLNTVKTAYADLDGDGFLDITAVNGGQGNPDPTVTVLFGTSNGKFNEEPLVLPSYVIGNAIAAGDINHDGKPDLVIGSTYHNEMAVFLNQGDRRFSTPIFTIPAQGFGGFKDLAIADFDGDGKNDVIALQKENYDHLLRFFHLNSRGLLTIFATIKQNGSDAEMEIGDINGDKRPDVVLANGSSFTPKNVSFVFGQSAGGSLSLTYGFAVEDRASGISINDLDNDGDNDLAIAFLDVTTPTRHSIQVLQNNGSGVFTFVPKMFLEHVFPPNDITTDDFNNDGKQDLAVLVGSNYIKGVMVMVTYGKGDCTYSGEKYYAASSSTSIMSTDLNGDNKIDLITASDFLLQTDYSQYIGVSNNTVSILFNDNFQEFKAPLANLWGATFIDAADFNNDGHKDLVSSWATNFYTSSVNILINDTVRSFFPEENYPSPGSLNGMKVGDFNGDGNMDAVSAHDDNSPKLAVYIGNGDGTLREPIITPFSGILSNLLVVGDFNSDKKDDIFVYKDYLGRLMLSNGNGTFSPAPGDPVSLPDGPVEIPRKGDFNNDNKLDLVITINGNVKLLLGNGAGQFTQSLVTLPQLYDTVLGDFNGDGNLDLAGMAAFGTQSNIFIGILGDGKGGFSTSFSQTIKNFSHNFTGGIVAADFDLDGFDDVAMVMSNTFGNLIIIPSGGTTPSWKQPIFYGVGTATQIIAADFNADGKPDLGFLGSNSRGVIYNTTGGPRRAPLDFDGDGKSDTSVFRPESGVWHLLQSQSGYAAPQFGLATDKLVPADYDGDGKTDLAVFRENPSDPGKAKFFILQSSNNQLREEQFGSSGDIPVAADWDGDGKSDVGVYRQGTEANQQGYFYYRPSSQLSVDFIPYPWGIAGDKPVVADYDGDGKTDPAVFRPSNGAWYIQRSQDGFYAIQFGASEDKPVAADYDGDGKADQAVFRPSNGVWYLWNSTSGFSAAQFGISTDKPVPADYDGDGKTDLAVYRDGTWFILNSTTGFASVGFGNSTDKPVPNSFVP